MATVASIDPRPADEASVLPVVARARTGPPAWAIVGGIALLGLLLFIVLDTRRRALTAPAVKARSVDALSMPSSAPTLYIPPEPVPVAPPEIARAPVAPPLPAPAPTTRPTALAPVQVYVPQPAPAQISVPTARPAAPHNASGPALVIDTTGAAAAPEGVQARPAPTIPGMGRQESVAGTRTGAGVLANRATTVSQGTLIPAVLETALDSTRPGLARAIVSRDIRGFDGSQVLIPRGSRLIGEYGSETQSGQNRMLVNWIRLIRPDGVTIAIGSPASDPLGGGGIRADVNSHFFERFGNALLQSALDVGVNLAVRSADPSVYVALPGSFQGGMPRTMPNQIRPTLKVKAATSISVFVARDLDFTGVEKR